MSKRARRKQRTQETAKTPFAGIDRASKKAIADINKSSPDMLPNRAVVGGVELVRCEISGRAELVRAGELVGLKIG